MRFNLEFLKKKVKKAGRQPAIPAGTHQKITRVLWGLFIFAFVFALFKNFTAIDKHTVHETEVIKEQNIDTNKVENFVTAFAKVYYSWDNEPDSVNKRTEELKKYLTEELQALNAENMPLEVATKSSVDKVEIWGVQAKPDNRYQVLFSVNQTITEGETVSHLQTAFSVVVYLGKGGDTVIVQNPSVTAMPKKSGYVPERIDSDGTVQADKTKEIEDFLTTFFGVYPKAEGKELEQYVKNEVFKPIHKGNLVFEVLHNPVYRTIDGKITVDVTVKYLDTTTKQTHLSQYSLVLEKSDTWFIIGVN